MAGKQLEVTDWAKGQVQSRWQAFRQESPYFQLKVVLGLAYAVVVVLTVILAPPRGEKWAVAQERINFGLSYRTTLKITNMRNGDLDDVVLELRGNGIEFDGKKVPGTWHTKPIAMPEGKELLVNTEQLFDARGENPPYALDVDDARVLDKKKRVVIDFGRPRKVGAP
jgi:hypothetical protein